MLLLVGLGNPGPEHARHRHNVGFMAVERIASRHGFQPFRRRFRGEAADGRLADDRTLILKPLTYMNESGRAVGEAMRFYKLAPEDVVVFYDEIDLAPGKVRVKRGGGTAGHNGIRSIAAHIGPDFRRVRIGVGHPGHKDRVIGYVLSNFAVAERAGLEDLLDAIADAAPMLAEGGDDRFQTRVAYLTRAPEDETKSKKKDAPDGD